MPVNAPFSDIAMHVVQAPGVSLLLPDLMRETLANGARIRVEPVMVAELPFVIAETESC